MCIFSVRRVASRDQRRVVGSRDARLPMEVRSAALPLSPWLPPDQHGQVRPCPLRTRLPGMNSADSMHGMNAISRQFPGEHCNSTAEWRLPSGSGRRQPYLSRRNRIEKGMIPGEAVSAGEKVQVLGEVAA